MVCSLLWLNYDQTSFYISYKNHKFVHYAPWKFILLSLRLKFCSGSVHKFQKINEKVFSIFKVEVDIIL